MELNLKYIWPKTVAKFFKCGIMLHMKDIKILPFGTKVKFGDPKQVIFEGKTNFVTIRRASIVYQVLYWFGSDVKEVWLEECDFTVVGKKPKQLEIGFRNE